MLLQSLTISKGWVHDNRADFCSVLQADNWGDNPFVFVVLRLIGFEYRDCSPRLPAVHKASAEKPFLSFSHKRNYTLTTACIQHIQQIKQRQYKNEIHNIEGDITIYIDPGL